MFEATWDESSRSKALMLGLPSVLLALLGVAFLCWAQFGMANSLEDSYRSRAEKSGEKKKELIKELNRESRMLRATQRTAPGAAGSAMIAKDDPRVIELGKLQTEESIYLKKLISLNQDNPEYLYNLALVAGEQGDTFRRKELMEEISPLNEPGYVDGHLWLARFYLKSRPKNNADLINSRRMALQHAEQCLRRDKDHKDAKLIKASTLVFFREYAESYAVFLDLFEDEPKYIDTLYELNAKLNREDRNSTILDDAINEFNTALAKDELSDSEASRVWRDLTVCYQRKKDFATAEARLLNEIKKQSEAEGGEGKRVWAERLLASVYLSQIATLNQNDPEYLSKQLEWLKKAFRFDPTNSNVLERLVRIGGTDTAIAAEAKQVYYPENYSNTPAMVLNEMGTQALSKSQYDPALRFFEMAKKKAPRNPIVLNNLAYTYLVGDNPNPKRALKLIDEAIRFLSPNAPERNLRMSSFHDTKGHALMQLNKMTDAILEFEKALRERPDNRRILEALVQCYEADGINASAYINRLRLMDLRDAKDNRAAGPGDDTVPTGENSQSNPPRTGDEKPGVDTSGR